MKTKNGGEERAHVIFLGAKDEKGEGWGVKQQLLSKHRFTSDSSPTSFSSSFTLCLETVEKLWIWIVWHFVSQRVWCWQNQCGNLDWWPLNLPTSQYQCGISLQLLCDRHYNWVQTRKPPTAVQKKGMFIFGGISCWSSLAVRFLRNELGKGLSDWVI